MADKIFNRFKADLVTAVLNWTTGNVSVLLIDSTSTYTPSDAHNFVSDVLANGGVELSTTNYSRQALASKTATRDDTTNHRVSLGANNVTWTNLGATGKTVKALLLFINNGADTTNDLIAYLDSGGPLALNGGNVTLQWGAAGVLTLT